MKIKTIEQEFKRIINKNKAHNYTQFNKINIFTAKGKGVFQMRKNAMLYKFDFFNDLNNYSKLGKIDTSNQWRSTMQNSQFKATLRK